jgi:hypothetical protein
MRRVIWAPFLAQIQGPIRHFPRAETRQVMVSAVMVALTTACGITTTQVEAPEIEGPPEFVVTTALQHAEQFQDTELRHRPAGSEQEQAATAYILGILQRNGYVSRLDAVPVRDLYRATNLIAQPRPGGPPEVMVTVAYDTPADAEDERASQGALALGLFLELSRALNAANPEHGVHFAALAAEHSEVEGGRLGSTRLARLMLDEGQTPRVIELADIRTQGGYQDDGAPPGADVFGQAGFDRVIIAGGIEEAGEALFELLSGNPR